MEILVGHTQYGGNLLPLYNSIKMVVENQGSNKFNMIF
jgi:hypothetical protein